MQYNALYCPTSFARKDNGLADFPRFTDGITQNSLSSISKRLKTGLSMHTLAPDFQTSYQTCVFHGHPDRFDRLDGVP